MTGAEISKIRRGAGLSQEQFGNLSGVNKMTVCRWEKMGSKNISAYKGKDRLQTLLQFLSVLVNVQKLNPMETQNIMPSPFNFGTYVDKGEPIVLSEDPAVPGDLVLVYNVADSQPVRMGIIISLAGDGAVILQCDDGSFCQTDMDTYCRSIKFAIHRPHSAVQPFN